VRPKKKVSRKIEDKLLELMQTNYNRLMKGEELMNVEEVKNVINKASGPMTRRALAEKLRAYLASGLLTRKKIGRNAFYYTKGHFSPGLFWKKSLKPFIDEMKKKKGSLSWGRLLIGNRDYYLTFANRAAILEDGIDITSQLPWEDSTRDVLGNILVGIKDIVEHEIKLRLKPKVGLPLDKQIGAIKEEFAGKKLAIVYVLDGSSLELWDKKKMGIFGVSPRVL